MGFENIRVKDIECVVRYKARLKNWETINRKNHIIGIKLCGNALHDLGYQRFNLSENCMYFLNQKDDYSVEVAESGIAFSVHFTTYEPIETDSFCIKVSNTSEFVSLLEKIEKEKMLTSKGDNLAFSYFYRLCALLNDARQKKYTKSDERMVRAQKYIDLHFKEKDCLKRASEECKISRRRFNELFKIQFDITPNRYIVMRKIDLAKQLLKSGEIQISEISEICGFENIYYFSKVFKSEVGISPGKYKNNRV